MQQSMFDDALTHGSIKNDVHYILRANPDSSHAEVMAHFLRLRGLITMKVPDEDFWAKMIVLLTESPAIERECRRWKEEYSSRQLP